MRSGRGSGQGRVRRAGGTVLRACAHPRGLRGRFRVQRVARFGAAAPRRLLAAVLVVPALVVAAALLYGIASSGAHAAFIRERLISELAQRAGAGALVSVGSAEVEANSMQPRLSLRDLRVAQDGGQGVEVGRASIDVDAMALLRLKVAPRTIELKDVSVTLPAGEDALPSPRILLAQVFAALGTAVGALTSFESESGALPDVTVSNLAVAILGPDGLARRSIEGLHVRARAERDGRLTARLSIGTDGTGAVALTLGEASGGVRALSIASEGLTLGQVLQGAPPVLREFDPRIPVRLAFAARIGGESDIRDAVFDVEIGHGRIVMLDADIPPFTLDRAALRLVWPDTSGPVAVETLDLELEGTKIALTGALDPPPAGEGGVWSGQLSSRTLLLAPLSEREAPLQAEARTTISLDPRDRSITLERFDLTTGAGTVGGRFRFAAGPAGGLALAMVARDLSMREALRLWPVNSAPPVRHWMVPRALEGRLNRLDLTIDFDAAALEAAVSHRPIPDESLALAFSIDGATLAALEGSAPLREAAIEGKVSGRHVRIDLREARLSPGSGSPLVIRSGVFEVPDTARKVPEARITVPVSGSVPQVLAFLRQPGLKPYAGVPLQAQTVEGTFEGTAQVVLPLVDKPAPGDVKVALQGRLRDVLIDPVAKGEKLEEGNFTIATEREAQIIRGEGKLSGVPAAIEIRAEGGGRGEAQIRLTLDDQQRAKRGLDTGGALSGPLALKLSTPLDEDEGVMTVEADLTRARLEGGIPGLSKRPGQPGKLRFQLQRGRDELVVQDLKAEIGPMLMAGRITFSPGGDLRKASLTTLRLSPGDNARAEVERGPKGFRIVLRGNSFDARPFLKSLQTGNLDDGKSVDLELDLKSTVLSGFGGELIAAADLNLARRNGELEAFSLDGRFDGGPVSGRMVAAPRGQKVLAIQSADAGAFLRFFDYYQRMRGGRMGLDLTLTRGSQTADLQIRDFKLRNEPAVRRFTGITTSAVRDDPGRAAALAAASEGGDVDFTKLRATFKRVPGRLTVEEAVMWGPQVGGSIEGSIDYARNQVTLNGTLVPAYALNNFFAQVPLFGPLLGGGQYEGLFAVRFAISGKASEPVLSVNPLTAIAPGFLRRLVDFGRAVESDPTVPPQPPAPVPGVQTDR